MRSSLFVFCLICVSRFSPAGAETASCGALGLRPLEGPYGYTHRNNRCEGIYVADVGAKRIELVSLTIGDIAYDLKKTGALYVSAYEPNVSMHVVGTTKLAGSYYRMDADLDKRGDDLKVNKLVWPTRDVLEPLHIDANRLGVVAWLKPSGATPANYPKVYLPVRVSSEENPIAVTSPAILLALRFNGDVSVVKWRSAPLDNGVCSAYSAWNPIPKTQTVGSLTEMELRGIYGMRCLDFAAKPKDSNEWMPVLPLKVLMPAK